MRFLQTDHEGEFVQHLHGLDGMSDAVVLNPGAWTHYSWAIHDALELCGLPAVEVHLSDVQARARSGGACRWWATCAWPPSPARGWTATARRWSCWRASWTS